jgi:pyrimidine oxygenase
VAGWNRYEYEQMGLWPGDEYYAERYDYSTEYVEVMQRLWATGRASYSGRYFQLDDCFCKPTPKGHIPIVAAGQSERGMRFAAEVADYQFMLGTTEQLKAGRATLDAATAKTGRTVGAYALVGVIAAPTDKEAVALAEHYIDGTDHAALENYARFTASDKGGAVSSQILERMSHLPAVELPDDGLAATPIGACFPMTHITGSYERVARHLDMLNQYAGLAGVVMTFPNFVEGVGTFGDEIMPRMTTRANLGAA